MKRERARRSRNVDDRRGRRGRRVAAGGGIGLVGIGIVVVVGLLLGKSPMEMLGLVAELDEGGSPASSAPAAPPDPESAAFIEAIPGETEDVWSEIFAARGERYPAPTLVLFSGVVQSACGRASSAVGPFYCPADQPVCIDTSFYDQMERRPGGGGDFAEAYVIAHEVGHHVQTVTGTTEVVHRARQRGENLEGTDGLLVRQELQADCCAGVWGHRAQQRHQWLEPGNIEEALDTASAIGDDHLQRRARGTVVPDSFTHGSAEQRVRWFRRGFESGDPARCDTFGAMRL
ncbi:neutral zinc metallopeptidase [Wenzhouxiangella sp. XN79A]|uniref:KPN_02809 family neutral zinc metallopeptidase n=1 Tax=Wenzhouxiangella sp. XN79A TaxID=2724193 RepID=UPI00144AD4C8|nr:neutral zinc metallopeptidase [Wenzhouxiangella sp. XN79A]NKI34793.1 neutral zinc metallopeptidase [Wenzhouxiangella sp. XN79A]